MQNRKNVNSIHLTANRVIEKNVMAEKHIKIPDWQIVLDDMKKEHAGQSSWDWPADYRFAKSVEAKDEIEILEALLQSAALFVVQIAAHRIYITKLKKRRLRALKNLESQGLVYSSWTGTGYGGHTEFGVRRIKVWHLTDNG